MVVSFSGGEGYSMTMILENEEAWVAGISLERPSHMELEFYCLNLAWFI